MNPDIQIIHGDCMEAMKAMRENEFDLAIVDPPYFDGPQNPGYYKGTKQICEVGRYHKPVWDIPKEGYFKSLLCVSKNQIIWGVNYFDFLLKGGRIVWVKGEQGSPFSMADIAYQSFYNRIDLFKYTWSGFWQESGHKKEKRIHPTQKPVALYKWLLKNYAKPGDRILDTHLGSGSIAIACWDMGFDLVGYEIDEDYYKAALERFNRHTRQKSLFT